MIGCILQEVVSTSNSNVVVSLTRLFEMLLTEPVKDDAGNKNIRTWIMVLLSKYAYVLYPRKCALDPGVSILIPFGLCVAGDIWLLPGVVCGGQL